ncbi:hypothetical protein RUND412_000811 [Rhizina undulata]
MSVRIQLDNAGDVFTCLDYVTGKVILNLSDSETISTITVKMEGIARTRLMAPQRNEHGEREQKRTEVEIHRFLYLTETVFPSRAVQEQTSNTHSGFTLPRGQYEYPFRLRIPINSACSDNNPSLFGKISFERGLDFARDSYSHSRGTLPPSLSGIRGDDAWIRYFLKATVNRPKFYKINLRSFDPFVFLPIEPPRPPPTNSETYAKRQHQFTTYHQPPRKRGIFNAFREATPNPHALSARFSIEVRLPSPPILVPNEPLPLRIILVKLENYAGPIVIHIVQIRLLAQTHIRAHSLSKDEHSIINVYSNNNVKVSVGDEMTPVGKEVLVDPVLLRGAMLPDTVPPSFQTCSISRSYNLEVTLVLSHGLQGPVEAVPLILPVQVYSGIRPPAKLLEAARKPGLPPGQSSAYNLQTPKENHTAHSATNSPTLDPLTPALPPRPYSSSATHPDTGPAPWQDVKTPGGRPRSVAEDDEAPPPAYENAIAADVSPVHGPRRTYQQEGAYYGELPADVR